MPYRARACPSALLKRRIAARPHAVPASRPISTIRRPVDLTTSSQAGPSSAPYIPARFASTSSPLEAISSFFSFSPRLKGKGKNTDRGGRILPKYARNAFLKAIAERNVANLREAYESLAEAIETDPRYQDELSPDELAAGMYLLATSSRGGQVSLRKMYAGVPEVFGYPLEAGHHSAMGIGLCRAGHVEEALDILKHVDSASIDWTPLLRAAAESDATTTYKVFDMLRSVRTPDAGQFAVLLWDMAHKLEEGQAGRSELDELLQRIGGEVRAIGAVGQADLARCYILTGQPEEASRTLRKMEEAHSGEDPVIVAAQRAAWCELAMTSGDREKVLELCRLSIAEGATPSTRATMFLVRHAFEHSRDWKTAVAAVERDLGIDLDRHIWAQILREATSTLQGGPDLDLRMSLYQDARLRGIPIDATLARLLIQPLCSREHDQMSKALAIYDDMVLSPDALDTASPDLPALYRYLLSALSHQKQSDAASKAIQLLKDAAQFEVTIPGVAPAIAGLMLDCGDYALAHKLFGRWCAVREGYVDVILLTNCLRAFLDIVPDIIRFRAPPHELYLDMIKTAQAAGADGNTSQHLTVLLAHYAGLARDIWRNVAEPTRSERLRLIVFQVIDLHVRIKLDPTIERDPPLLNAMMNAYNRAQDPARAMEIFNELVEKRPRFSPEYARLVYPATVSVGLDICAFSKMPDRAEKIWAWGRRHGFADDAKQWNDYVECLCRRGKYARAVGVVLDQMNTGVEGAPAPDLETVRVLLKFSFRMGAAQDEVVGRVREECPEHWEALREEYGTYEPEDD